MDNHLQSKKHKDNYARFKETVALDDETEDAVREEEVKKQLKEEEELQRMKEERHKELDA